MTKRELFVKAHKLTKEIVKETGVNYRTQFGICLSFLYEEEKEEVVTIETIEKKAEEYCDTYQNEWYAKVSFNNWVKYGYDRTYIEIAEFRKGTFRGTRKCGYWDNIKNEYVAPVKGINLLEK